MNGRIRSRMWLPALLVAGLISCSDETDPTQPAWAPQMALADNIAPIAAAGGPYTVTLGNSLKLDGTASTDPDEPTFTLKYLWNFGEGHTSTSAIPTFTYAKLGVYTLTLTVTDRYGAKGVDSTTVTVQNLAPVANPGGPYDAEIGVAIKLSGLGSTDDRPISELKYLWTFHDGTTSTSSTPQRTYKALGEYSVTLKVTDRYGLASETVGTTVTVGPVNQAPVAKHGGPYTGYVGVPVIFDGAASSDPDGNLPLTYLWTFGDGATSTEAQPSHTYTKIAKFTVTLTVKDARGKSSARVSTTANIVAGADLVLMKDDFTRTVSEGWGSADKGGSWVMSAPSRPFFSVDGSRGVIEASNSNHFDVAGAGPANGGDNTLATYGLNVTGLASFRFDRAPDRDSDGRDTYHQVEIYARRNDRLSNGDNFYRFRVLTYPTEMRLSIQKEANGEGTHDILAWDGVTKKTSIPLAFDANAKFWVRFECFGTSPSTTVRMRVWKDGTPEPTGWQHTRVVDEPRLDQSGTTGVRTQVSASQVNFPVRLYIDNLEYRKMP